MICTDPLSKVDPDIARLLKNETERKEFGLELIPSENCVSEAVLQVTGSVLTDKYCEGYPGKRYYGGCHFYDEIEQLAIDRAKELFGAEYANVQPHSGANANMAVFLAFMGPGDLFMGPRLDHGGHLTHGSPVNFSGKFFHPVSYGVRESDECFDMDEVRSLAKATKPKLIVCGATAYSRQIDFAEFRKIADEVGAIVMADVSHYSGLIVGGAYDSPFPHAHIVTTTTHKTLRGPRGGLILAQKPFAKAIRKMVFPGTHGGPLMHQIAAKAVAFKEALQPEFKVYAKQILANARALAAGLMDSGFKLVSGGTDSHMMMVDLRGTDTTGAEMEDALGKVGITVNKNTVPYDPKPPAVTSGIRLGTPVLTTRGMKEIEMGEVAKLIHAAVDAKNDDAALGNVREQVVALCKRFPLYPEHRFTVAE